MIGIYEIRNRIDGKRYIGRAVRMDRRLYGHRRRLRLGDHENPVLQAAFNKHGDGAFDFRPVLICSRDDCPFYEVLLVAGYQTHLRQFGYNLTEPLGEKLTHTAEARAAISAFQRVFQATNHYAMTPEIAEKIAAKLRGRVGCNKGRVWPAEIKAKFGAPRGNTNRKGKSFTDASKAKIAAGVRAYFATSPSARDPLYATRGKPKSKPLTPAEVEIFSNMVAKAIAE